MRTHPERQDRILLRLGDAEESRIRLLGLQCRVSINDVIRQCIEGSIDAVEARLVSEATRTGKFRELGSAMERIDGLRLEARPELAGDNEEPTKS